MLAATGQQPTSTPAPLTAPLASAPASASSASSSSQSSTADTSQKTDKTASAPASASSASSSSQSSTADTSQKTDKTASAAASPSMRPLIKQALLGRFRPEMEKTGLVFHQLAIDEKFNRQVDDSKTSPLPFQVGKTFKKAASAIMVLDPDSPNPQKPREITLWDYLFRELKKTETPRAKYVFKDAEGKETTKPKDAEIDITPVVVYTENGLEFSMQCAVPNPQGRGLVLGEIVLKQVSGNLYRVVRPLIQRWVLKNGNEWRYGMRTTTCDHLFNSQDPQIKTTEGKEVTADLSAALVVNIPIFYDLRELVEVSFTYPTQSGWHTRKETLTTGDSIFGVARRFLKEGFIPKNAFPQFKDSFREAIISDIGRNFDEYKGRTIQITIVPARTVEFKVEHEGSVSSYSLTIPDDCSTATYPEFAAQFDQATLYRDIVNKYGLAFDQFVVHPEVEAKLDAKDAKQTPQDWWRTLLQAPPADPQAIQPSTIKRVVLKVAKKDQCKANNTLLQFLPPLAPPTPKPARLEPTPGLWTIMDRDGKKHHHIKLDPHDTVGTLKLKIEEKTKVPPARQILKVGGRELQPDTRLLSEYKLTYQNVIYLCGNQRSGASHSAQVTTRDTQLTYNPYNPSGTYYIGEPTITEIHARALDNITAEQLASTSLDDDQKAAQATLDKAAKRWQNPAPSKIARFYYGLDEKALFTAFYADGSRADIEASEAKEFVEYYLESVNRFPIDQKEDQYLVAGWIGILKLLLKERIETSFEIASAKENALNTDFPLTSKNKKIEIEAIMLVAMLIADPNTIDKTYLYSRLNQNPSLRADRYKNLISLLAQKQWKKFVDWQNVLLILNANALTPEYLVDFIENKSADDTIGFLERASNPVYRNFAYHLVFPAINGKSALQYLIETKNPNLNDQFKARAAVAEALLAVAPDTQLQSIKNCVRNPNDKHLAQVLEKAKSQADLIDFCHYLKQRERDEKYKVRAVIFSTVVGLLKANRSMDAVLFLKGDDGLGKVKRWSFWDNGCERIIKGILNKINASSDAKERNLATQAQNLQKQFAIFEQYANANPENVPVLPQVQLPPPPVKNQTPAAKAHAGVTPISAAQRPRLPTAGLLNAKSSKEDGAKLDHAAIVQACGNLNIKAEARELDSKSSSAKVSQEMENGTLYPPGSKIILNARTAQPISIIVTGTKAIFIFKPTPQAVNAPPPPTPKMS